MSLTSERQAVHAYVSPSAKVRLDEFLDGNGISLTGFMEALANELADEMAAAGTPKVREELVDAARAVDTAHRKRGAKRRLAG